MTIAFSPTVPTVNEGLLTEVAHSMQIEHLAVLKKEKSLHIFLFI
jgi:hypothetical protein